MVKSFYADLEAAKTAERLVLNVFSSLTSAYNFKDVSNDRAYWKKGDILAIDANGREIGIEVKQDSRIAQTNNVLCEEKVLFFDSGMAEGNMQSNYNIYCVVSPQARKIWCFDFNIMKQHYKIGRYIKIPHEEQITFAYLVSIAQFDELGALIAIIDY